MFKEVTAEDPEKVLGFFEAISAIPHGSYHIDQLSDYLVAFAGERGLECIQDDEKNVIIKKPAQGGAASAAPLMLQGHIDMVLEKNAGVEIDMEKEPIRLIREGDILRADGTTLGADDGIAVAMMMAALDDKSMVHPPLECVFTTNEEVGMDGMAALDASVLQARKLINLDSEDEGVFTVGCAGGAHMEITLPIDRKMRHGMALLLKISGLKGGHSGMSIHLGRANADYLMTRVLMRLSRKADLYIDYIRGGSKDNAIPRECEALVLLDKDIDQEKVEQFVKHVFDDIRGEYKFTDPDIALELSWEDHSKAYLEVVTKKDTKKILRMLTLMPNGLIESDPNIKDMPQTSLSLGILDTKTDDLKATLLIRSSINSQKRYLVDKVKCVASVFDAEAKVSGEYPAWEYAVSSPLRDTMAAAYEKRFGKAPEITITHGGLECGLLSDKIKGLDCISIGPDMKDIHTPDEHISISSIRRTWDFLADVLEALAGAEDAEITADTAVQDAETPAGV